MLRRLALAVLATAVACGSSGGGKSASPSTSPSPKTLGGFQIQLTSSAFTDGGAIPAQYTCDGANQSPPLAWATVPPGTMSLALRLQDIDTPQKFVHWIVYDFPPSITSMATGQAPPGAKQATNSFGKQGYGGPCPPAGSTHRYVFTLLALGTQVNVSENLSPNDLWSALENSAVVAKGELTGTYKRTNS